MVLDDLNSSGKSYNLTIDIKKSIQSTYTTSHYDYYADIYIEGNLLNYDDAINDLICVDENGNKKTIFSGHSYGDIWIFSNRIFIEKVDDGDCWPVYSMKSQYIFSY